MPPLVLTPKPDGSSRADGPTRTAGLVREDVLSCRDGFVQDKGGEIGCGVGGKLVEEPAEQRRGFMLKRGRITRIGTRTSNEHWGTNPFYLTYEIHPILPHQGSTLISRLERAEAADQRGKAFQNRKTKLHPKWDCPFAVPCLRLPTMISIN
jgi:hypothetical protein